MLDLLRVSDRHHPGHHRHRNAVGQQPVHIVVHHIIVEEHLGHQKLHATVHFNLQFFNIIIETGALRMTFRIAGAAHTKIPKGFNLLRQVAGMPVLRMLQGRPLRQVATQRQDVINALALQLLQHGFNSIVICIDTGEMRHGRHAALVHFCRYGNRFPGVGPAGPIGHADKGRLLLRNGIYDFQCVGQLASLLGRKQLAGHARFGSF